MIRSILATSRLDYAFATRRRVFCAGVVRPADPQRCPRSPERWNNSKKASRKCRVSAARRSPVCPPGTGAPRGSAWKERRTRSRTTGRRAVQIVATPSYFDVLGVAVTAGPPLHVGRHGRDGAGRGRRRGVRRAAISRADQPSASRFASTTRIRGSRSSASSRASSSPIDRIRSSSRSTCRSRRPHSVS